MPVCYISIPVCSHHHSSYIVSPLALYVKQYGHSCASGGHQYPDVFCYIRTMTLPEGQAVGAWYLSRNPSLLHWLSVQQACTIANLINEVLTAIVNSIDEQPQAISNSCNN